MITSTFRLLIIVLLAMVLAGGSGCSPAEGNETGHEFIPDMAHSIAYEANTYHDYSLNSWNEESVIDRKELSVPREPVAGTIARGYAGERADNADVLEGRYNTNAIYTPANGSVPYYYEDTEEERERATAEITTNPYPITDAGLATGKELYTIYCGICHGDKGDGAGYLLREDGGVYPAQPANFLSDEFLAASEGRYYHSVMYGKNVMGGYADKLSYEERWQVIHYIRALQAAEKKLVYNETENTLNNVGVPAASLSDDEAAETAGE